MIHLRAITTDDPLYDQACALREEVLLMPLGLDMDRFRALYPHVDAQATHIVAVADSPAGQRVVGCALVLPDDQAPGRARLMQMAVHPQRQREGIGRRLLAEAESIAFGKLRQSELVCHAQLPAVSFYERCGWTLEGGEFEEAGIPHRRLRLENTAPPALARGTSGGEPQLPQ